MPIRYVHNAFDETVRVLERTEINLLQIRCKTYRKVPQPGTILRWRCNIESVSLEVKACEDRIPAWTEGSSELSTTFGITSVPEMARKRKSMCIPVTLPVSGSMFMNGLVLLCCPSFVISTTMRGSFEVVGNVYRCSATRRVEVSSTRTPVDSMVWYVSMQC